ncbi:MAG: hypothetical protein C1943_03195 [Halochromatium sp.]|nr:hypothetical protein [Halochromatium sp.]
MDETKRQTTELDHGDPAIDQAQPVRSRSTSPSRGIRVNPRVVSERRQAAFRKPSGPLAWRREGLEIEDHDDGSRGGDWTLSLSDVMMLLFMLFAVLVALHIKANQKLEESVERQRQELQQQESAMQHLRQQVSVLPAFSGLLPGQSEQGQAQPATFEDIQRLVSQPSLGALIEVDVLERSREALREAQIDHVEIIRMSDESVKVSVKGPMFFELGEATLRSDVRKFLDRLARVIQQTSFAVQVIGHTDDYPVDSEQFPTNWELSAARAARVARYLIDSAGIDPRRFTVMGRGEFQPAVENNSDANRSLNRRVEIIVTRQVVEPVGLQTEMPLESAMETSQ